MGKQANWPALIGYLSLGMMGSMAYIYSHYHEKQAEREAFEKLDVASMSPKEVWEAALALSAQRRRELGGENRSMRRILDQAEEVVRVTEGIKACGRLSQDLSVPTDVKKWILQHWTVEWARALGVPEDAIDCIFNEDRFNPYLERIKRWNRIQRELQESQEAREVRENTVRCSFCEKTKEQVKHLVVGPGSNICDACVALAQESVDAHTGSYVVQNLLKTT